jgi:hypothetical protein
MTLRPRDVTAIIVTRGNTDLLPILNSLPYAEVEVWDNSVKHKDAGCAGRYLAMLQVETEVCFTVDDDVIFTAHDELLAAFEPGRITCNMPSPWYERTGYPALDACQLGAGALCEWWLPQKALALYEQAGLPQDRVFLEFADLLVGMLTPYKRLDLGYQILPLASEPGRTSTMDGHGERRAAMIERAMSLRQPVAA